LVHLGKHLGCRDVGLEDKICASDSLVSQHKPIFSTRRWRIGPYRYTCFETDATLPIHDEGWATAVACTLEVRKQSQSPSINTTEKFPGTYSDEIPKRPDPTLKMSRGLWRIQMGFQPGIPNRTSFGKAVHLRGNNEIR
jgi:hypothetical protein